MEGDGHIRRRNPVRESLRKEEDDSFLLEHPGCKLVWGHLGRIV